MYCWAGELHIAVYCRAGELQITVCCMTGELHITVYCWAGELHITVYCMAGELHITVCCMAGELHITVYCRAGELHITVYCRAGELQIGFCVVVLLLSPGTSTPHFLMNGGSCEILRTAALCSSSCCTFPGKHFGSYKSFVLWLSNFMGNHENWFRLH